MPDTDVLVSELTQASAIDTNDLMLMTQPDAESQTGYASRKGTVLQVATKVLKNTEYTTDLPDFTDKTIIGALKELKADTKPVKTANGNPASFTTDLTNNLISVKANIVTSGGGGTPSTPIPIVGHSELNLVRCGKNFVPKGTTSSSNGITFTVQDNGEVIITGTATATAFWAVQFTIPVGSYVLNGTPSDGGGSSYTIDVRNAPGGSGIPGINGDSGSGSSFTRTEPLTAWCNIRVANGYACPTGGIKLSPMIRLASEPSSEYAPYNGQTYTIAFGQTVYGGVLHIENGRTWFEVTHELLDLSTIQNSIEFNSNYNCWIVYQLLPAKYHGASVIPNIKYEEGTPTSFDDNDKGNNKVTVDRFGRILIGNNSSVTKPTAKVAYELATPFDIDLTPVQIRALVGTNNITSDLGGNLEVQYADGQLASDIIDLVRMVINENA